METSATNLFHEPAVAGFVVSLRDVSEQERVREALNDTQARYDELVQRAREVVYEIDPDGRFTSVNSAAVQVTGYTEDELLTMSLFDLIAADERDRAAEMLARVLDGDEESAEVQMVAKDGRQAFIEASARCVPGDGGSTRIVGIARDITQRRELEERLRYEAFHDMLTGLPNRALLLDRLTQALARRGRDRCNVAVMVLGIDEFKLVNDELGHAAGDEVLVELASRFKSLLRKGETIARLAGDEFAVVADHMRADGGPDALAERILSTFARPFPALGEERRLTASVGIAVAGTTRQQQLSCCVTPTPRCTG